MKLRFKDLKARGYFQSRMSLKRAIDSLGFPPGRLITPNIRVWDEDEEVTPWVANRPTARKLTSPKAAPSGAAQVEAG